MGWATIIALALAATSTPQQFNLECAGTVDTLFVGGQTSSPYRRVLRIDLATKQWCADRCSTIEVIAAIQPTHILLRDVTRDTPREYWRETESVDRTTGYHSKRTSDSPPGSAGRSNFSSGKCDLAPFTGFEAAPHRRF